MQKIRINEATLKKIIYESTKKVLQEISPELKAAAAMTAADKAYKARYQFPNNGAYAAKLRRQANNFANSARDDFEKQNPLMKDVSFDPDTRGFSATFNGQNANGDSIRYSDDNFDYDKMRYNNPSQKTVGSNGNNPTRSYSEYDTPENGFVDDPNTSDRDVRRYGRFKDQYFNTRDKIRNYR